MSKTNAEPAEEKIKPAYGAVQSYSAFFDLCERIKIDKVDTEFVQTRELASKSNEYKLINGLKFLGLLKADCTITEKMKTLGIGGKPFQDNLNKIVHEAYKELFETVKGDLQKATPQDIVNSFRGESYQMSPTMAKEAAKVFVFLSQKSGIQLSQEITDDLSTSLEKQAGKPKSRETEPAKRKEPAKQRDGKPKLAEPPREGNYLLIPNGMLRLEYQNKVLMFLPEGDKKSREISAKIARQFIETYEAEGTEKKEEDAN